MKESKDKKDLIKQIQAITKNEHAAPLIDSKFRQGRPSSPTDVPIINVAFSGSIDGGLECGFTILAGPSKHFKSMLGLYLAKAQLTKYPKSRLIIFDSEDGITDDYLESLGLGEFNKNGRIWLLPVLSDLFDFRTQLFRLIESDVHLQRK